MTSNKACTEDTQTDSSVVPCNSADDDLFTEEKVQVTIPQSTEGLSVEDGISYLDDEVLFGCDVLGQTPEPRFDPEVPVSPLKSNNHRHKRIIALLFIVFGLAALLPLAFRASEKEIESIMSDNNELSSDTGGDASEESETKNDVNGVPQDNNGDASDVDTKSGFKVKLLPFSQNVLSGYSSCSALMADIEEAGKYLSNVVIKNIHSNNGFEVMSTTEFLSTENSDGLNSYETNNQIDGVDEADSVKSDGNLVYAAYGNELIVISLDGTVKSRTIMPQMSYSFPVATYWNPEAILEKDKFGEDFAVNSAFKARSSAMPAYHSPTQSIRSMLLHNGRLVVIVSGFQYSSTLMFLDAGFTAALIYDIDHDTATLSLVDKKTIRGNFKDARAVENRAYVVTHTGINSYLLSSYLRSWMFPENISDAEYKTKAFARAQSLIPQFAKQIVAELLGNTRDGSVDDYKCGHIVGLSLMQTSSSLEDNAPDLTSGSGILNSFVQTTSFDIQAKFALSETVSGAFLPSNWMEVYSTKEALVVSSRGWRHEGEWKESTFLMGFDVSGNAAVPKFVGHIPGYLLNQFSIDYYQGHLRVATTNSAKWGVVNGEWAMERESHSQITILEKNGNELHVVGKVEDLAPGERIYSVRFMQDRAAVVTFRQIDPFYTFDLSEPTAPKKVGELKIRGFSNYLHPIKDKNYILTVGQDANEETGRPLGLQVTLFDVTDFANPEQIHKVVVEGTGGSSSVAQFDHRAFHYVEKADTLILPVSRYSHSSDSELDDGFDGFYLYHVDVDNGIEKVGEVIHADPSLISKSCFSWAYLLPRSMVFQGSLMTFKGHSILMTDMFDTSTQKWFIDLDEDRTLADEAGCMPWFM